MNTWKLNIENPRGVKLVRTNDSATVSMKQTWIELYGIKLLYNHYNNNEKFYASKKIRRHKINDGVALMPYSLKSHKLFAGKQKLPLKLPLKL